MMDAFWWALKINNKDLHTSDPLVYIHPQVCIPGTLSHCSNIFPSSSNTSWLGQLPLSRNLVVLPTGATFLFT